jgi:hypothetical protein
MSAKETKALVLEAFKFLAEMGSNIVRVPQPGMQFDV